MSEMSTVVKRELAFLEAILLLLLLLIRIGGCLTTGAGSLSVVEREGAETKAVFVEVLPFVIVLVVCNTFLLIASSAG